MASGQSSVAVDVHNDGFISPAVAVSPGLEPDDVEQSSVGVLFKNIYLLDTYHCKL